MKGSKLKIVNNQIFGKAGNLWPYFNYFVSQNSKQIWSYVLGDGSEESGDFRAPLQRAIGKNEFFN